MNVQTMQSLLQLTLLSGIAVRGFQPHGTTTFIGMLRDVDGSLFYEFHLCIMRASSFIRTTRHMGNFTIIRVRLSLLSGKMPTSVCYATK